jgi:hypothetical protein
VDFIKFLHERLKRRQVRRSIGHREDDELHVSPFSGCDDDVPQCRDELWLMSREELFVVDVEPDEDALHSGLEVRCLEEET